MTPRALQKSTLLVLTSLVAGLSFAIVDQVKREGYTDTPMLPGQPWRVHDVKRPYPHEVDPGPRPGAAPADAIVLFDGKDLSQWMQGNPGDDASKFQPAKWKVAGGAFEVVGGTGSLFTREKFGDCQLHLEWQEDKTVEGSGQGRGNSGIYLMGRYEIQILDSYRAATYADGQAGAIYGQWPPMVNPIRKPGEWQTYDIMFEAPRFDGEKLVSPAYVTVLFNGVLIHNHQKLNGLSAHAAVLPYYPHGAEERMSIQDHGPKQPIRFRNIWVRKLKGYDQPE